MASDPRALPGNAMARLSGDHLMTVRDAVADTVHSSGMASLAQRYRSGELDEQPMMQAAALTAERLLRGMFE